jgi:hypothetical protein
MLSLKENTSEKQEKIFELNFEDENTRLFLVNAAVEDSIESLGPYIRTLNHTDFKIHVHALRAAKVSMRSGLPR